MTTYLFRKWNIYLLSSTLVPKCPFVYCGSHDFVFDQTPVDPTDKSEVCFTFFSKMTRKPEFKLENSGIFNTKKKKFRKSKPPMVHTGKVYSIIKLTSNDKIHGSNTKLSPR